MHIRPITPPAVEPVSLADLKVRLSIDHDHADDLLESLIAAARATVERLSGRLLLTQTWQVIADRVPADGVLVLPLDPVQSVSAVNVADATLAFTAFPLDGVVLDLVAAPARLLFTAARPAPGVPAGGLRIDVVAGYGPTPAAVPAELRQAAALLAAHWYEHRGLDERRVELPAEVRALAAGSRRVRL